MVKLEEDRAEQNNVVESDPSPLEAPEMDVEVRAQIIRSRPAALDDSLFSAQELDISPTAGKQTIDPDAPSSGLYSPAGSEPSVHGAGIARTNDPWASGSGENAQLHFESVSDSEPGVLGGVLNRVNDPGALGVGQHSSSNATRDDEPSVNGIGINSVNDPNAPGTGNSAQTQGEYATIQDELSVNGRGINRTNDPDAPGLK